MGFIYKITNLVSKKCYIGETIQDIKKRWRDHLSAIKRDGGCKALKSAIEKYGLENFKFEVLIICFDEDRLIYEKEYIKKYNSLVPNGYNILEGGQEGVLGFKHSEETKKLISLKSKEYFNRPEVKEKSRQNMIELNKRIANGEITKKSIKWYKALEEGRIGGRGKELNDETKKKISEGVKKYFEKNDCNSINRVKHSEIMTKVNGRKVSQYTKEGVLLETFNSMVLAGIATKIKHKTIQAAATGRIKMAGGFIWKYTDEKNLKPS
jgi:group I intron endonuclease